jgi:hypothetical protein
MLELYSKVTKKALFCLNHCSGAVLPGLMPNDMIFTWDWNPNIFVLYLLQITLSIKLRETMPMK